MQENQIRLKFLGQVGDVTFWLINAKKLRELDPKWNQYLGSHHWDKGASVVIKGVTYEGTSYIPREEVWISNAASLAEIPTIMVHEFVERPIMRTLIEGAGPLFSRERAWDMAHPVASYLDDHLKFKNADIQKELDVYKLIEATLTRTLIEHTRLSVVPVIMKMVESITNEITPYLTWKEPRVIWKKL